MCMTRSISYVGVEKPFTSTNTAWHGYTGYSPYDTLCSVLGFQDGVVSGYKEVRHGGGTFEEFRAEMDFLLEVCPQSLLILNTRDVSEVVLSQVQNWDGGNTERSAFRKEVAVRQHENFMHYCSRNPQSTRIIDYRDIVDISTRFVQLLSDIDYAHDMAFVRKILQFQIG